MYSFLGIVMLLALAATTSVRADAVNGAAPSAGGATEARFDLAQAQPAPEPEKKRVPKDEDKKKSDESETQQANTDTDEDGGFFGACFGACIGDFFANLFGSDEEAVVATPVVAVTPPPGMEMSAIPVIGYGAIQHPDSLDIPVQLWDGPGGTAHGHLTVALLAPGTAVGVTDTRAFETGDWVEVQSADGGSVRGWVQAEHVDWAQVQPEAAAAPPAVIVVPAQSIPNWAPLGTQTVAFMPDVSWFYLTGPKEVREEYEYGGLRVGLNTVFTPSPNFHLTLGLGYGELPGEPLYDYVTGTTVDSPHDSRLQIFDLGLRFGQYTALQGGRTRVYWGLGPAYYWVKESAEIDVSSASTGLPLGTRTEEHSWSRFGADAALGFSYEVSSRLHLGGLLRGLWISWDAEGEESLTLDFIGDKSLGGFGIGLSLAYDAF